METDTEEVKKTITPTNNEQNEDLSVTFELVDTEEDRDWDKGPVILQFGYISIPVPIQQNSIWIGG